ncbi:unnamed protein product [Parnassius mnemosyne]|uniref:Uncharacterized protein n=1 Tax=Parnassius mnemosyne TaxID=213953 RepID=A0AAV1KR41_9NEOP
MLAWKGKGMSNYIRGTTAAAGGEGGTKGCRDGGCAIFSSAFRVALGFHFREGGFRQLLFRRNLSTPWSSYGYITMDVLSVWVADLFREDDFTDPVFEPRALHGVGSEGRGRVALRDSRRGRRAVRDRGRG